MSIKHTKEWAQAKINRLEKVWNSHCSHDWNGWSEFATATHTNAKGLRIERRMQRIWNRYFIEATIEATIPF